MISIQITITIILVNNTEHSKKTSNYFDHLIKTGQVFQQTPATATMRKIFD